MTRPTSPLECRTVPPTTGFVMVGVLVVLVVLVLVVPLVPVGVVIILCTYTRT